MIPSSSHPPTFLFARTLHAHIAKAIIFLKHPVFELVGWGATVLLWQPDNNKEHRKRYNGISGCKHVQAFACTKYILFKTVAKYAGHLKQNKILIVANRQLV